MKFQLGFEFGWDAGSCGAGMLKRGAVVWILKLVGLDILCDLLSALETRSRKGQLYNAFTVSTFADSRQNVTSLVNLLWRSSRQREGPSDRAILGLRCPMG